ncbi:MAG: restriction endonuclease subunit S [[Clostridium] innocuum]|nr:restriction endonuclease subunit S [[Clostridium] innocuum]MDY3045351.1 restriction endonuclease subunit S [[Clostridium] innocuum]
MAFVWEQRKLGDLVERITKKNQDLLSELPLTISAQYGLIDQKEFFDKRVASKDISGYYLIKNGEFAYNKSTSTDAPWGAIKRLDRYETGVLSTLYIVFGIKKDTELNSNFLTAYYSTNLWHKEIHEIAAEGARNHGLLNISPADFFKTKLSTPQDLKEQNKIGNYFIQLDQLITLHQRKRMLRRCFFSIDWEQRKLGEVAKYRNGKAHENCIDDDGKYIVVNSKFVSTNGKVKKFSNMQNEPLFENEVAFVLSDVPNGRAIARTFLVEKSDKYTLNQRIAGITPLNETDPYYLHVLMNRHPYFLAFDDGVKQTNLSVSDVMKFESYYPKYEEQETIGRCFSQLDQLITLHQCKSNFCKKNEVNAWEQRKVSEIADRFDNLRVPVAANLRTPGTTPYYGANGIQDYVEGYTHDGEFVLVAEDGANDLKNYPVKCVNGRIWVNNHAHVLQARPQIASNQFLAYSMSQANIEALLVGGGRAKLNAEVMMGIVLRIPRLQEQEVIGGYFYKLDQLITLHQWECNINENTEGNDEKQRKPIKKLIISEGNLSLVDDMFLLHRMTFLVCNKYILLRLNVVKYKITIIIISNILYSIVSLLIIACYLIVINKQLIILIYVEISVVIIKGDDDYARIRS